MIDELGADEPFLHDRAICETDRVGARTRIWAFAHVLPGAKIGQDCNICDGVFIENDVVVGDRVTVKSGVQLWDGLRVGDDVFVGPNATFANDLYPRSREYPESFLRTVLEDGASIGAGATILPGIVVGRGALVGAGAVVTRDVPAHAKVVGNPARIVGYADSAETSTSDATLDTRVPASELTVPQSPSLPEGVQLIELDLFRDLRGSLAVAELGSVLPFEPRRYFVVHNVPSREVRGEHAHRKCSQFLSCVTGSVSVHLDDGRTRSDVDLDSPGLGVLIPPMVWASQYSYSEDAALVVLASHRYEADDYIRDYSEFLALVEEEPG